MIGSLLPHPKLYPLEKKSGGGKEEEWLFSVAQTYFKKTSHSTGKTLEKVPEYLQGGKVQTK